MSADTKHVHIPATPESPVFIPETQPQTPNNSPAASPIRRRSSREEDDDSQRTQTQSPPRRSRSKSPSRQPADDVSLQTLATAGSAEADATITELAKAVCGKHFGVWQQMYGENHTVHIVAEMPNHKGVYKVEVPSLQLYDLFPMARSAVEETKHELLLRLPLSAKAVDYVAYACLNSTQKAKARARELTPCQLEELVLLGVSSRYNPLYWLVKKPYYGSRRIAGIALDACDNCLETCVCSASAAAAVTSASASASSL